MPATSKAARVKRAPLARVLKYRNQRIINNFLRSYDLTDAQAQLIFEHMLKYLWLAGNGGETPMLSQMFGIDEMWHSFILHTKDYREFCEKYFGVMLEHDPESYSHPRKAGKVKMTDKQRTEQDAMLDQFVDRVFDELGAKTATAWFSEKFDKAHMARRHRFVRALER